MTPPPPAPGRTRRHSAWLLWLLVLAMLAFAGWRGWAWWQAHAARDRAATVDTGLQLEALNARLDGMRRDQRAQAQRLQQADATNRILRDELLGMGQRAALIEDSVSRLADPDLHGAQALRLDEAELLLSLGQQRLLVAGDLDGARRAYALAEGVLRGVDDPAYLSLRQALVQETAALEALGTEPRALALARLEAFASRLGDAPPAAARAPDPDAPWWRRALSNVFDIQPRHRVLAVRPADRADALAGLQLELTLARAAAERRDATGFRAALSRADTWLQRLWAPSPHLDVRRGELRAIAALPLAPAMPTLGSTLEQLRQLRAAR